MELFAYYNNKLIEALVKCTKTSLDLLRTKAENPKYFDTRVFLHTHVSVFYFCFMVYVYAENAKDKIKPGV